MMWDFSGRDAMRYRSRSRSPHPPQLQVPSPAYVFEIPSYTRKLIFATFRQFSSPVRYSSLYSILFY